MRWSALAIALLIPALFTLTIGIAIAQSNSVQVLSYTPYNDSLDYYHVVGEVQNVGSMPLSQVTVAATLCDQSGQQIETIEDYIMIDLLVPQQKSPFDLFENATGTVCGASAVNSTVSDRLPYPDLQLASQSASRDAGGIYRVAGQVANTGTSEAQAVQVIATFYDANGVVVQAGSSMVNPSNLSPGGVGYFEVTSDDPSMSSRIASFSLQAQSATPSLPIPEYRLAAPVLALSLVLAVVIARRKPR